MTQNTEGKPADDLQARIGDAPATRDYASNSGTVPFSQMPDHMRNGLPRNREPAVLSGRRMPYLARRGYHG